jgi:prophage regulatory protein
MNQASLPKFSRILRIHDLILAVGLAKSTLYAKIKNGTFPAPIKLSDRAVGWDAESISMWLAERKSASIAVH